MKYLPILALLFTAACADSCSCGHEPGHSDASSDEDAGSDDAGNDTDGGK